MDLSEVSEELDAGAWWARLSEAGRLLKELADPEVLAAWMKTLSSIQGAAMSVWSLGQSLRRVVTEGGQADLEDVLVDLVEELKELAKSMPNAAILMSSVEQLDQIIRDIDQHPALKIWLDDVLAALGRIVDDFVSTGIDLILGNETTRYDEGLARLFEELSKIAQRAVERLL